MLNETLYFRLVEDGFTVLPYSVEDNCCTDLSWAQVWYISTLLVLQVMLWLRCYPGNSHLSYDSCHRPLETYKTPSLFCVFLERYYRHSVHSQDTHFIISLDPSPAYWISVEKLFSSSCCISAVVPVANSQVSGDFLVHGVRKLQVFPSRWLPQYLVYTEKVYWVWLNDCEDWRYFLFEAKEQQWWKKNIENKKQNNNLQSWVKLDERNDQSVLLLVNISELMKFKN